MAMAQYSAAELERLRERWLAPPHDPAALDGCPSFGEFLRQRLAEVAALLARPADQSEPPVDWEKKRPRLRAAWEKSAEPLFRRTMAELAAAGLEAVLPLPPAQYSIREPVDLRGADCRGASFLGAHLENADFTGAELSGADFRAARCLETRFAQANCREATFAGAECQFARFDGAQLDNASFAGTDCSMVRFDRARLKQAGFGDAKCYATAFHGALLANAELAGMRINHFTTFGTPGEQLAAKSSKQPPANARQEGDDWYIVELLPLWLKAAEVNAAIRQLLKGHGYFIEADEYQYQEMVCRRHLLQASRLFRFYDWFFKDLIFGYGLKWKRPFITLLVIITLWGIGFFLHFYGSGTPLASSLGNGFYYSVISFTTLGLGNAQELTGFWPKFLICSEALLGTILMPIFLLAYARKILQD
ncbi:pentapeptide repeat-containing protein [Geotalea uraniireducens]|nr:pentapeptide repeat-containing protein [Geotalea uraniireducens]